MKVIRQGYNPQSERTYRCKYCDCIFEVESEEIAEKYIADNDLSIFRNLYHITKIPLYEGK